MSARRCEQPFGEASSQVVGDDIGCLECRAAEIERMYAAEPDPEVIVPGDEAAV